MYGAQQLIDANVQRAAEGVRADRERIAQALEAQVRGMVAARLSPHPGQLDAAEEIAQQAMMAVVECLPALANRTVGGLRSLVSVIVARRVADFLRGRKGAKIGGQRVASLDSTVADRSNAGPLWQFLSAGGPSPLSAVCDADQMSVVLNQLGGLKDDYREIITLAFFDQLATREIADRIGTTRRAASMLLLRAIRELRRRVIDSTRQETSYGDAD